MFFFFKEVSALGVREPLLAPQARAEVRKVNPVLSAVCKGETASITGTSESEQSIFYKICEQCRREGATVSITVIKANLVSFLMMSLHWYWFPQAKLPLGYFKINIASIQRF